MKQKLIITSLLLLSIKIINAQKPTDSLSIVVENSSAYYINSHGKRIGPFLPASKKSYVNEDEILYDLYPIEQKGKWGVMNSKGNIIVPCIYSDISVLHSGFIRAIKDNLAGGLDKKGKIILPFIYESIDEVGCGYDHAYFPKTVLKIKKDNKYGLIEAKTGRIIVPPLYEYIEDFSEKEKVAIVYSIQKKKYGLVNYQGNVILPVEYDTYANNRMCVDPFEFGTQIFKKDKQYYVVDGKGSCKQLKDQYDYVDGGSGCYVDYGIVRIFKNNKYGLMTIGGRILQPCRFDKLGSEGVGDDERFFQTENNGCFGFIDEKGNEVVECVFYYKEDAMQKLKDYCDVAETDKDIPLTSLTNSNTFAILISNENYQEANVSNVNYAKRDGDIFKEYCLKTLGIPENNIHYRIDATLNQIRSELRWVNDIANAFGNEANIIFYYTGHGIPDEKGGKSYLLPVDGIPADVQSAYALSELYKQFGTLPVKRVTVFLDACFSGAQRDGNMLVAAKGVAIKSKAEVPQGNMVVMSASQGDETAHYYKKKRHGLFSYFLFKKLQESKGDVTLGELGEYIKKEVSKYSIVNNGKSQTPSIMAAQILGDNWKNMKLK